MHLSKLTSTSSSYRPEIDGLRAFAVLSVVIFHAFPTWLKGGFVGVDVFFVISGFLITRQISRSLDEGQFSFLDFFSRRIRRLFPALIIVFICSLVLGWFILLGDELNLLGKHIASGAAFVSNFVFSSEVGYFDTASDLKPMLHLWSLAVEEQFYIFWPLALWVTWIYKRNLLFVYLLFFAASFSLSIGWTKTHPTELFFWSFGRFWEFLAGGILAWLIPYGENILKTTNSQPHTLSQKTALKVDASNRYGITTLLGLIFLVGSVALISKQDPFPYYLAAYPVLGTFLVILGGNSNPLSRILLSNRLATWLGLISYPLYLWHWPLLSYLHIMKDGSPHRDSIIFVVALSFLLAWFTFRFFEKPLRRRTANTPLTVALLMAVSIIGVIGLTVSLWDFKASKGVYFREGLEHHIGSSNQWYKGEDGWLFLGNAHYSTIEKLKLSKVPSSNEINLLKKTFEDIAIVAQKSNTQLALIIGPNKSSIYADRLPPSIPVSSTRYVNFFLNSLRSLPSLTVCDPTNDLIKAKHSSGLLYYRTDTHWNDKGAYIAYKNFLSKLKLEAPEVSFTLQNSNPGDLIKISKLKKYPLVNDDTWLAKIQHIQQVTRNKHPRSSESDAFGESETATNRTPLHNKKAWVVGDSFSVALRPYLEATFSEVTYLGHWDEWSHRLASFLDDSPRKPDIIIIVQVERAF